ncbi:uncharacterized protein LOC128209949 [Mya arenaria]|uniref:uncharacterized protein LOC128209949 n=1 Tax=Mya arenaria TaxID=6604 RepID=UPI0022E70FDC|nr:uncharacterized protein LOC128209949 [Mya arenaria]
MFDKETITEDLLNDDDDDGFNTSGHFTRSGKYSSMPGRGKPRSLSISSHASVSSRKSTTSLISGFKKLFWKKPEDELQNKYENLKAKKKDADKRNSILERENAALRVKVDELDSIIQLVQVYESKIENFDPSQVQLLYKPQHIQIGNENSMSIEGGSSVWYEKLNGLLITFFKNLQDKIADFEEGQKRYENVTQDLKMLQQELDSTRNERQIVLEAVTEMKETLNDLNDDIKASPYDKKALNIYYAIGLAETNTMENCINALRSLSQEKIEPTSTFRVLPEKAKLGVARILKKYPTQSAQGLPGMTNEKFLKCLEMKSDTDSLAEMELSLPITHDSCAFILFRWVMSSRENNSEKLCRIFPRLKNYGTVCSEQSNEETKEAVGAGYICRLGSRKYYESIGNVFVMVIAKLGYGQNS